MYCNFGKKNGIKTKEQTLNLIKKSNKLINAHGYQFYFHSL